MKAEKLKGLAVISIAEGARLGRVEDVLFDPRELRIGALRVGGDERNFVLPFEQVKQVGVDAVTVESGRAIQVAGGDGMLGLGDLTSLKAVDEAGNFIGTVAGVEIDTATGHIENVTAHKGGVLGLGGQTTTIVAGEVRVIGPDVMTVRPMANGATVPEG